MEENRNVSPERTAQEPLHPRSRRVKGVKRGAGKHKKITPRALILDAMIVLCAAVFLVSAFFIVRWLWQNAQTKSISDSLASLVGADDSKIRQSDGAEVLPPLESDDEGKIPYYSLSMQELLALNPDTVAWIRVAGTEINYPVVQGKDNSYYLKHNFEYGYTDAGWIFGDYRCDFTRLQNNRNLIVYGHGRRDMSMFGSLEYCRRSWWLNDSDLHTVHITTPTEETVWRVFAVYTTDVEFYYIRTDFTNDAAFLALVDQMKSKSFYDFDQPVEADDTILTLSTCTTDADRLVLQAVLVEQRALTD